MHEDSENPFPRPFFLLAQSGSVFSFQKETRCDPNKGPRLPSGVIQIKNVYGAGEGCNDGEECYDVHVEVTWLNSQEVIARRGRLSCE